MKLSKRLAAIDRLIGNHQTLVWDCCCDHGYLGKALLKRNAAQKVIFVDIIANIMKALRAQLEHDSHLNSNSEWQVLCQDVGAITLSEAKEQVVVIAGVGGELLLKLMQQIIKNNSAQQIQSVRFILCPVHHTYLLRDGLKKLELGLLSEQIIYDKQRFYELIEVSFSSHKPISNTGSEMWHKNNVEHAKYKKRLLRHYTNMLNKDAVYYQQVINDYQLITNN